LLSELNETIHLTRLLRIYRRISKLDPVLDEEIGKQGAHLSLSRLIKLDIYSIDCCQCGDETTNEANQDTIIEIQDLACEIAAFSKTFPVQASPFMREDLRARLPLVFTIRPVIGSENCGSRYGKDGVTILINQVTDRQSAQKDVGFVMWPSAVVLSRWLVSNPSELHGKNVLELGAGCGLTGLVAAKILQDFKNEIDNKLPPSETTTTASPDSGGVVLSDFNETVLKNLSGNIGLNDLNKIAIAEGLDFYQQDPNGNGRRTIDGIRHTDLSELILAADVICQPEDAFAAARTIASALKEGCKAIVVSADSKHRFGVEKLEEACNVVGCLSVVSKSNVDNYLYDDSSSRDSDDSSVTARDEDMEKTSGFVHGMTLTMYTIVKNSTVVQ
jgi:predicted nicotinamide N-methyase